MERLAGMIILLALAIMDMAAKPLVGDDGGGRMPSYVRLVGDSAEMQRVLENDSLFYALSGGVVFKVNRWDLRDDDPFVRELCERVLPSLHGWELVAVGLRGAASPEGPYQWNQTLSKRRAATIMELLANSPQRRQIVTQTVAEDYVHLVLMMRQAGDADTDVVADIVTRYARDQRRLKIELQRIDRGRLWKRLLKQYFPDLRMTRLVLFFQPAEKGQIVSVPDAGISVPELPELVVEPLEMLSYTRGRRHKLALGTNLLYDAFYMPNYGWAPLVNVEAEFYPRRGRWTALAAFTFPYYHKWDAHQFFQIRDYHLEVRRYFRLTERHTGWFAAAYVNTNKYGIGLSGTKGWQGEGVGGALKAGYVWPLGRKGCWRLEVSGALGGYLTRFDPYVYGNPLTGLDDGKFYYDYAGNPSNFRKRNYQRVWMGPTELGIKLRWDILYYRTAKGKEVRP